MTSQTFKSAIVQGSLFLPGIHGLRGVAALAVILYHLVKIVGLNPPDFFGFIGRDFGYGVQLFFVISAFSLCCSTEKFIQQSTWTVEYFIKRFFRIAPLFYFMLAFEVSRQFLTDGVVTTSLSNILLNLTFTFGFAPPFSSIVWAGWTIGVEMIFYAIFPVLLLTIRTHRAAFIFLVLSILVSCCMRYELYMQLKNLTILEKSLNVVQAENSKRFYEQSTRLLQEQNAMTKEMLEMQREEYKQKKELPPKMLVTALEEYEEQLMRMVDEE